MARVNFNTLITQVKTQIEAYASRDFKHVERIDWVDTENGLKRSAVNYGYSVLVDNIDENFTDFAPEDKTLSVLSVNIQFALNASHDKYLVGLGYCMEAILSLNNISYASFKLIQCNPWFESSIVEDMYIIDFVNLYFIILNE